MGTTEGLAEEISELCDRISEIKKGKSLSYTDMAERLLRYVSMHKSGDFPFSEDDDLMCLRERIKKDLKRPGTTYNHKNRLEIYWSSLAGCDKSFEDMGFSLLPTMPEKLDAQLLSGLKCLSIDLDRKLSG